MVPLWRGEFPLSPSRRDRPLTPTQVVLSSSSDLSVRIWGAKDGINPRTFKGHTRAVTALGIIGVGRQIVSASLDGTVRVWDVGQNKEIRRFELEKKAGVQEMILVDEPRPLAALGAEGEERVVLAGTQSGLQVFKWSDGDRIASVEWGVGANMVSMAYSPQHGLLATGHTNGVIALRKLESLEGKTMIRRNEASVYSLRFDRSDLLVGTAAGLPARLSIRVEGETVDVGLREEYAGWEAVGVETWDVSVDGAVWVAGGEGGVRRY